MEIVKDFNVFNQEKIKLAARRVFKTRMVDVLDTQFSLQFGAVVLGNQPRMCESLQLAAIQRPFGAYQPQGFSYL